MAERSVGGSGCGGVLVTGLLFVVLLPLILVFWPVSLPVLLCMAIERRAPGWGFVSGGALLLLVGVPMLWWLSRLGFVEYLSVPVAMLVLRTFDTFSHDLFALVLPGVTLSTRLTVGAAVLGGLIGAGLGSAAALARTGRAMGAWAAVASPLLALPLLRVGPSLYDFHPPMAAAAATKHEIEPRAPEIDLVVVTPGRKSELRSFRWSATRINCGQWAAVYPKTNCDGKPRAPKSMVTWDDAVTFCNRLSDLTGRPPRYEKQGNVWRVVPGAAGYRLPSAEEWAFVVKSRSNGILDRTSPNLEWMWDTVSGVPGGVESRHGVRSGAPSKRQRTDRFGSSAADDIGFRVALDGSVDR